MRSQIVSSLILSAAVALPAAAIAASDPPTAASASGRDLKALENRWAAPLTFNSFDSNRDGYISRDEAAASPLLSRQFDQLDKNGDGKLSQEELSAAAQGGPVAASRDD